MSGVVLAPRFAQVAWAVKDIEATEEILKKTMGIRKFFRIENLKAADTQGTYKGRPADWVIHLSVAYAGAMQIEIIQPVSGTSVFQEAVERHGDCVQHIAYWLTYGEYDAAAAHMESLGYPLVQSFSLPMARIGYFDTREALGVITEIVGATPAGDTFLENIRTGNF